MNRTEIATAKTTKVIAALDDRKKVTLKDLEKAIESAQRQAVPEADKITSS